MTGPGAGLFDTAPYEAPPKPDPDRYVTDGMGQDARRTARRRALIEDGIHPATRLSVTKSGTCGNCGNLVLKDLAMLGTGRGRYWKCQRALRRGKGPDITLSWPSCTAWTPAGTKEDT